MKSSFSVKNKDTKASIYFSEKSCLVELKSPKFLVKFKETSAEKAEEIINDFFGLYNTKHHHTVR